jgi:hypothetical protein
MVDNYDFNYYPSDSTLVGNTIGDYISGNTNDNGYTLVGSTIDDYVNNGDYSNSLNNIFGNFDWGKLGRYSTGLATGLAAMQAQKKPDYMFTSNWAGNGLARMGTINNRANKADSLNRAFGAGDYINSLFRGKLGGTGTLDNLQSASIYSDYNPYASSNTVVGNAINDYMRK